MTDADGGHGEHGGPEPAGLDRGQAQAWVRRWEAQQQVYLSDREDRFTTLIDAVEEAAGRPDPLVLDLGCGPGSLSVRLLDRLPRATVVAIDADPVLLALGRAAWAGRPGLRFARADLRVPGWAGALELGWPADAAISTTALHWLTGPGLAAVYAEVASVLRPGGLLLDGDHLRGDTAHSPVLARLSRALLDRAERRHPAADGTETWASWWQAVGADPALAGLLAQRQALELETDHHGSPAGLLRTHVDALRGAGFAEVGTLWQRGDNRLLCGVLAG
ncbi:MAG TPA: class I SAM-dependent methyltransferase [Streptosporangiaceae bacterium]|jgi:SAM-dependent methyltransferase